MTDAQQVIGEAQSEIAFLRWWSFACVIATVALLWGDWRTLVAVVLMSWAVGMDEKTKRLRAYVSDRRRHS